MRQVTFGRPESDDHSAVHVPIFVDGERLKAGIVIENTGDSGNQAKYITHEDTPLGTAAGREWPRLGDAMRDIAAALQGDGTAERPPAGQGEHGQRTVPAADVSDGVALITDAAECETERIEAWRLHDSTELDPRTRIRSTRKLVRSAPGDLSVLFVHAHALDRAGRKDEAVEVYRRCLAIGTAALPTHFAGRVARDSEEGIALLDAAGELGRCALDRGEAREGIDILERLLLWEPDGDHEAARRLGSAYAACGDTRNARRFVDLGPKRLYHAPYDYDLALVETIDGNWEPAIAALLRGLATSPYIGELLLGTTLPGPIPMVDTAGGRDLATANDYAWRYRRGWRQVPEALTLLRWVQTHPVGMNAVATARRPDHAGAYQRHAETRARLAEGFRGNLGVMPKAAAEMLTPYRRIGVTRPWEVPAGHGDRTAGE